MPKEIICYFCSRVAGFAPAIALGQHKQTLIKYHTEPPIISLNVIQFRRFCGIFTHNLYSVLVFICPFCEKAKPASFLCQLLFLRILELEILVFTPFLDPVRLFFRHTDTARSQPAGQDILACNLYYHQCRISIYV
jgi:hypothetical protein